MKSQTSAKQTLILAEFLLNYVRLLYISVRWGRGKVECNIEAYCYENAQTSPTPLNETSYRVMKPC